MKLVILLLISFGLTFSSCKKEKIDRSSCYSCANETYTDTLVDYKAKVVIFSHDPVINNIPTKTYGFTIVQADLTSNTYIMNYPDSLLVPCPGIPTRFKIPGKVVKITGYLKSCDKLLSCYNCNFLFGRKFELTNIK